MLNITLNTSEELSAAADFLQRVSSLRGGSVSEAQPTVPAVTAFAVPGANLEPVKTEAAAVPTPAPVSQPAPVVPDTAAVTPAPVSNIVAGETDVNGMLWDKRIHAKTKTKIKDGSWKIKRGVDTNLVAQVKAEQASIAGTAAPVTPAIPAAPVEASVPAVPAAPIDAAPTTQMAARSYDDLGLLVSTICAADDKIGGKVLQAVQSQGYNGIPDLQVQSPENIAVVYNHLENEFRHLLGGVQ